jgi:hypothetical protein
MLKQTREKLEKPIKMRGKNGQPGIRHSSPDPIAVIITPRNVERSSSKHVTLFSTLSIQLKALHFNIPKRLMISILN